MANLVIATGDLDLRARALAGEDDAFEALIGPLVEPAIRLAYSILGDRWEAEDVTQEAITRAWSKLGQLSSERLVRPWFLTIVANLCRNVRRTHWFHTIRVPELFRPSPDPNLERIDVARAMRRLAPRDQAALFMFFYLDLPMEEVAEALGVSTPAAKARVYRACQRLRPDLSQEDR